MISPLTAVGQLFGSFRASPENPTSNLANPASWLVNLFGGGKTSSGRSVSQQNAQNYPAVYAARRILSEGVAGLPLLVYKRTSDTGREVDFGNPLQRLLNLEPNPLMDAFTFWDTITGHAVLWGNGYAAITRTDGAGVATELSLLLPNAVEPFVVMIDGQQKVFYRYNLNGQTEPIVFPQEKVLHLKGPGFNGLQGLSPITLARQAIGLGFATEEFGASFFGNGGNIKGVLEHPGELEPEAGEKLRDDWQNLYSGLSNAHRVAVLEQGMKYQALGISPEDSQFLETRKFQINEIARVFKVPPHMLSEMSGATFSNIEQQSIDFVVHSLRPWLVRFEKELNRKLFITPAEQKTSFVEFRVEGLLRGDTASRFASYQMAIQSGFMKPDEARKLENLPPEAGGDKLYFPLNYAPLEDVAEGDPFAAGGFRSVDHADDCPCGSCEHPDSQRTRKALPAPSKAEARTEQEKRSERSVASRLRLRRRFEPIFKEAAKRLVNRETDKVSSIVKRTSVEQLRKELEAFYVNADGELQTFARKQLEAPMFALAFAVNDEAAVEADQEPEAVEESTREFTAAYIQGFSQRYARSSLFQLLTIAGALEAKAEIEDAINTRLAQWQDTRAEKVARRETEQQMNASTRNSYQQMGVQTIRWVTVGENCPICSRLNGKVIEASGAFAAKGDVLEGDDEQAPIKVVRKMQHPPAHDGCDCTIAIIKET